MGKVSYLLNIGQDEGLFYQYQIELKDFLNKSVKQNSTIFTIARTTVNRICFLWILEIIIRIVCDFIYCKFGLNLGMIANIRMTVYQNTYL